MKTCFSTRFYLTCSQTNFELPHKTLLHHLRSLKQWMSEDVWEKYPIARTSWCIRQPALEAYRASTRGRP